MSLGRAVKIKMEKKAFVFFCRIITPYIYYLCLQEQLATQKGESGPAASTSGTAAAGPSTSGGAAGAAAASAPPGSAASGRLSINNSHVQQVCVYFFLLRHREAEDFWSLVKDISGTTKARLPWFGILLGHDLLYLVFWERHLTFNIIWIFFLLFCL